MKYLKLKNFKDTSIRVSAVRSHRHRDTIQSTDYPVIVNTGCFINSDINSDIAEPLGKAFFEEYVLIKELKKVSVLLQAANIFCVDTSVEEADGEIHCSVTFVGSKELSSEEILTNVNKILKDNEIGKVVDENSEKLDKEFKDNVTVIASFNYTADGVLYRVDQIDLSICVTEFIWNDFCRFFREIYPKVFDNDTNPIVINDYTYEPEAGIVNLKVHYMYNYEDTSSSIKDSCCLYEKYFHLGGFVREKMPYLDGLGKPRFHIILDDKRDFNVLIEGSYRYVNMYPKLKSLIGSIEKINQDSSKFDETDIHVSFVPKKVMDFIKEVME